MLPQLPHELVSHADSHLSTKANSSLSHLIEALLDTMKKNGVPQSRVDIYISGDDAEQGSHVGVDHAAPLGYASHPHLLAQQLNLKGKERKVYAFQR